MKNRTILVKGSEVTVTTVNEQDPISLTDMLRAKEGDVFIGDRLRNRNTVEFLGIWESVHDPEFNYGGSATTRNEAGLNRFRISAKDWVEQTNAIGLRATAGRYGCPSGFAFEFGMWISPEFKVYLVKQFRRLRLHKAKAKLDNRVSRTIQVNRSLLDEVEDLRKGIDRTAEHGSSQAA